MAGPASPARARTSRPAADSEKRRSSSTGYLRNVEADGRLRIAHAAHALLFGQ
jgi:hypothetical protein